MIKYLGNGRVEGVGNSEKGNLNGKLNREVITNKGHDNNNRNNDRMFLDKQKLGNPEIYIKKKARKRRVVWFK